MIKPIPTIVFENIKKSHLSNERDKIVEFFYYCAKHFQEKHERKMIFDNDYVRANIRPTPRLKHTIGRLDFMINRWVRSLNFDGDATTKLLHEVFETELSQLKQAMMDVELTKDTIKHPITRLTLLALLFEFDEELVGYVFDVNTHPDLFLEPIKPIKPKEVITYTLPENPTDLQIFVHEIIGELNV